MIIFIHSVRIVKCFIDNKVRGDKDKFIHIYSGKSHIIRLGKLVTFFVLYYASPNIDL